MECTSPLGFPCPSSSLNFSTCLQRSLPEACENYLARSPLPSSSHLSSPLTCFSCFFFVSPYKSTQFQCIKTLPSPYFNPSKSSQIVPLLLYSSPQESSNWNNSHRVVQFNSRRSTCIIKLYLTLKVIGVQVI